MVGRTLAHHDFTADGKRLAISATSPVSRRSQVYVANRHQGHGERTLRVQLRMIDMPGETSRDVAPQVVVELSGGRGTINVNSWSPDATQCSYVTFEAVPPKPL